MTKRNLVGLCGAALLLITLILVNVWLRVSNENRQMRDEAEARERLDKAIRHWNSLTVRMTKADVVGLMGPPDLSPSRADGFLRGYEPSSEVNSVLGWTVGSKEYFALFDKEEVLLNKIPIVTGNRP
jgi:hypothetical protein